MGLLDCTVVVCINCLGDATAEVWNNHLPLQTCCSKTCLTGRPDPNLQQTTTQGSIQKGEGLWWTPEQLVTATSGLHKGSDAVTSVTRPAGFPPAAKSVPLAHSSQGFFTYNKLLTRMKATLPSAVVCRGRMLPKAHSCQLDKTWCCMQNRICLQVIKKKNPSFIKYIFCNTSRAGYCKASPARQKETTLPVYPSTHQFV